MALQFYCQSSALPPECTVIAFRGSEGFNRPYQFDVWLHLIGEQIVDLEDAIGARASLLIEGGPQKRDHSVTPNIWFGIISSIEHVRAVVGSTLYKVTIVPQLWDLTHTRHSRIFTKINVPDMIKAVLEEEGITNFEFRLTGSYELEEHICQYRESSLDFIHRWMEREGLYYFFEQLDTEENMVITDDLSSHDWAPPDTIAYHPSEGDHSAGAHFNQFTRRHQALPATVKLVDYDYTKPKLEVAGQAPVSVTGTGELAVYGNRFFTSAAGNRLAKVRAEDLQHKGKHFICTGAVVGLSPGFKFDIWNHPRADFNDAYVVTTIDHFGFIADIAKPWGQSIPHKYDETYRIELEAIHWEQQYRHPLVTQWPRVDGYENAIVDGAASSDYAQLDSHGRYAVKFKFDEGTLKDGKASTWVRKMQPHAGTVEGWHFPERKGAEVIVAFLAGDPDRPMIVGAIPNAITPSPVTSANNTRNVIQTGGLNRLEIEDLEGVQRVHLTTPHANTGLLMGNQLEGHEFFLTTDGNSHHNTVIDHLTTVGGNHVETVGATLSQTVTSSVTQTWNDAHTLTIAAGSTQTINALLTTTVNGPNTHTTNGPVSKTINGSTTTTSNGSHTQTFTGQHESTVGGDVIEKYLSSHRKEIAADMEEQIEANHKVSIGGIWESITKGVTDWTFQSSKSEKTLGMNTEFIGGVSIGVTVGASIETVFGASVDMIFGFQVEGRLGGKFEFGPDKAEAHITENKLRALESTVRGLYTAASGVYDTQAGVHSAADGLRAQEGGLLAANYGLQELG